MENNIQAGLSKQNIFTDVKLKKQEEINNIPNTATTNLGMLDKFSISSSLNNKEILDINNNKGFLELSKTSIKNIDDGISKLHDLNSAFNSLEAGHKDRINILNRTSEIVQDIQNTIHHTNFNNKSIALASNHNIGSNQISIGSNERQENSQMPDIDKIDKAINMLTSSKEKIQEKIDALNDFLTKEEVFVDPKDQIKITQKELDIIQENLRDRNDLLSASHRASNEKIANLFF